MQDNTTLLQPEQRGPSEVQTSQPLTQNHPQSQPSQPTQPTTTQNQHQAGVQSKGKCAGKGVASKGAKEARKTKIGEINGQN